MRKTKHFLVLLAIFNFSFPRYLMIYQWQEISDIPKEPGVYAWYFSPEITDFDLSKTIQSLHSLKEERNFDLAKKTVQDFLSKNIFRYFEEDPYEALLNGSMKPKYQGKLHHIPTLSSSLIDRILEEPERLKSVKTVLANSAPYFASPLYIGMAEKLGKRLMQHKKLIEKYRSELLIEDGLRLSPEHLDDYNHSFAFEVCKRQIIPSRLFVAVNILQDKELKQYVDIENILNRIHFPLFGRN